MSNLPDSRPCSRNINTVCITSLLCLIIFVIFKTSENLTLEDSSIYRLEVFKKSRLHLFGVEEKSINEVLSENHDLNHRDAQKQRKEDRSCTSEDQLETGYPEATTFDRNTMIHHNRFDCKFNDLKKFPDYGKYSDSKTYNFSAYSSSSSSQKVSECESYLSKGEWELSDFTKSKWKNGNNENIFQDIQFNPNTTYKKNLNQNGMMRWVPSANCRSKVYDNYNIHQCLSNYYPRIQIIGDSRSLVIWNFFKKILAYNDLDYDQHSKPNTRFYKQFNRTSDILKTISLRHDYYVQPEGTKDFLEEKYGSASVNTNKIGSNLIIINQQVMHNLRGELSDGLMAGSETIMREELMPYLKKLINDTNTTVVFFDCEHVEVSTWGLYKTQASINDKNEHMDRWNNLLKELVPDLNENNRIFRISANMITAKSPIPNLRHKTLLFDGVHLGLHRIRRITPHRVRYLIPPQPIMVDINIMLNLICNKYLDKISLDEVDNKEEYCCSNI